MIEKMLNVETPIRAVSAPSAMLGIDFPRMSFLLSVFAYHEQTKN
jgi:hypothetical protein